MFNFVSLQNITLYIPSLGHGRSQINKITKNSSTLVLVYVNRSHGYIMMSKNVKLDGFGFLDSSFL